MEAVWLMGAGKEHWGAVFRRAELLAARRNHPDMTVRQSVQAANFDIRAPQPEELPFQFDNVLKHAQKLEEEASWLLAAEFYLENWRILGNEHWMKWRAAWALYRAGGHDERALAMCQDLNARRPTVDSLHLAEALARRAQAAGRRLPVLLEVNVSGEASKSGFAVAGTGQAAQRGELLPAAERLLALPHLDVQGLMTIAPLVSDPEQARPYFRALRQLRDELQQRFPQTNWRHLSMGMTDDFEVAIEEGATMVRLGRAIFGER
jgi:pyridoxal phosphate enzyme (YggS family)